MLRPHWRAASAVLAATAFLAAACTGTVSTGGSGSGGGSSSGSQPHRGGTLTMLGQSDIFNLDTVSAYYTVSSMLERMFTRQLFSYGDPTGSATPPPVVPDIATTVPTEANGGITDGGKTLTIHLRQGVKWDTTPARQVTAADFVREFKMLCNPSSPVGAPGYFTGTIVGMASYCTGFAKAPATVAGISSYVNSHNLPGVVATNPSTLTFHLLSSTPDFLYILTMGFCSARPAEYMKYVPDSAQFRQHTISDGPYQITSYVAGKSFTLARNPAWSAASDPLRHAYVNKIDVTEGLTQDNVQQQLVAGTGDMEWDVAPPAQDLPGLVSSKSPNLVIGPTASGAASISLGTYLTLNQYAGPMKNKLVREAVAYAVNKNAIVQILGGKAIGSTTAQLILPGNVGYMPNFNPFPDNNGAGNPAKAKQLLAQAHQSGVTVKLLYSTTDPMPRVAQSLQSSLDAAGFKVKLVSATQSDFYGKYLENPTTAKRDVWDLAPPGWIPDWFGNNGRSTVVPLLTQPGPGSNDFGGYTSSTVQKFIDNALAAPNAAAANTAWQQADAAAMKDAALVPVNVQKWPIFHSSAVHGCNFFWFGLNCDPTNVWLSK
ncbi:MAG TPA: ABC transporter substrate-binding protein [Streptosporangiaceae bacterium]|nr:ABC transporter substrate-binding protein [Streptosporangiaceae bacterium]